MNNFKNNDRLLEIRTAFILNKLSNLHDRKQVKGTLIILLSIVEAINEDYKDLFYSLLEKSRYEQVLGASRKELYAMLSVYYEKPGVMAKKYGLTYNGFRVKHIDLINSNYINDDYVNSLKPVFIVDNKTREICTVICDFVDNFDYLVGARNFDHCDDDRTYELEFYVIYSKLINIFRNSVAVEKIIYNITTQLDLEWSSISFMLRGLFKISRQEQTYGATQLKQELFNLYYLKGFKKSLIGANLFGGNRNYYSHTYSKQTKDITNDNFEFKMTYISTLQWEYIEKDTVIDFIELFKTFADAEL